MFAPVLASAQGLPAIARASEVETGTFPNGIRYYLVTDKSDCGRADCALVQKGADPAAVRDAFVTLPHFGDRKPYEFLASKGIGYTSDGYAGPDGDALLYRFDDVPVNDAAATDSTLMMLFDLCTVSPYEQAVIVSGDISAAAIKGKMSIFAMTVPVREKMPQAAKYEWSPSGDVKFTVTQNRCTDLTRLTLGFASPRTSEASLGTIQVLVTERLFGELDIILRRRIQEAFKDARIPLGNVSTAYRDAASGPGDEMFSISVDISKDDITRAAASISKVLVNLDKAGVPASELADARAQYKASVIRDAAFGKDRDFIMECAAEFLYGTPVRPATASSDFIAAKDIPIETETGLFNSFSAALFDSYENLSFSIETPLESVSRDRVLDAYMLPWSRPSETARLMDYAAVGADTLKLVDQGTKVKMKAETQDPATGGTMWTFSNGLRVIWKKAATPGQIAFTFMVRGGSGSIKPLSRGEGAYLSDMMCLYDVAGMKYSDFNSMLQVNGIDMRRRIGVSDLRLEGTAPAGKAELLVKSILSFAKYRRFNEEAYGYWRKASGLRAEAEGLDAEIDAAVRPDYTLTTYRYKGNVPAEDLPARLESYLAGEFGRFNDGIIMIAGDISSEQVLKLFSRYGGNFPVSKVQAMRAQGEYQLKPSLATNIEDTDGGSVTIAMSSLNPVTAERYYAFRLIPVIIESRLPESLRDAGLWVSLSDRIEMSPMERFCMTVTARPALESGLPAGIVPQKPSDALISLRDAVKSALQTPVSAAELAAAKAILSARLGQEFARPERMVECAVSRYSEGKDLYSKYQEVLGAVSAEAVGNVMSEIYGGCRVEYIGE